MSSTVDKQLPTTTPASDDLKLVRRHSRRARLFDPELLRAAFKHSLVMLRPDIQWKNPVMFVVEVGTVLTLIYTVAKLFGYTSAAPVGYLLWLDFWLVATLLFANFASSIAEARGTWGCGRLTRQVVISLLMLGTPFHKGESQTKNGSRGAKMVAALSSSYLCYNLSPSFPAQARQDDAECGGYAFALLQFHPEDAAGVELDSLSRTDYLDHESGVQICVSGWKRKAILLPWRSTAAMRRRSLMDLSIANSSRFSTGLGNGPKRSASSLPTSWRSASVATEEIRL